MFKYLRLLMEPLRVPVVYRKRLGSGRAVSVIVSDNCLESDSLVVKFERKIKPSDVVDGKLVQISHEEVKRRGGKRSMTFALSYESAEALQIALKGALRDARQRRFWHTTSNKIMFSIFEFSRK